MKSSLIGKVLKAKRYAQEQQRAHFSTFTVLFRGEHGTYQVTYQDGSWECSCQFFGPHGVCSHTMALQRILGEMLPDLALAHHPA